MRCIYCNADVPAGSRFCPECGKPVSVETAAPQQPNVQPEPELNASALNLNPQPQAAPQQTYQQPQYNPQPQQAYQQANSYAVPPQQTYQQPQSYTQPQYQPTQPAEQPKKKSKKGLVIGLTAGALVLIALLVGAYLLFFSGTPTQRALNGTLQAFNEMSHAGNLGKVTTNLEKLQKSGKLSADASLNVSGVPGLELTANLQENTDAAAKLYDGSLQLRISAEGETADATLRYATDLNDFQLALDGMDGTYGVNLKRLQTEMMYLSEDEAKEFDLDNTEVTLALLKKGPLAPVFESLKTEEAGQTRIVTGSGDKTCKHYVLTWDSSAVDQAAEALEAKQRYDNVDVVSLALAQVLGELEPKLDLYVEGNRIRGVDATSNGSTVYLRLLGNSNPFEHVRLSAAESSNQVDLYWQKAESLRLCMSEDGQETEVLHYEDASGNITLNPELMGESLSVSGTLLPTASGASFQLNLSGEELDGAKVALNAEVKPQQTAPKLLDSSYKDLTKLSDDEQEELMSKLMQTPGLSSIAGVLGSFGDDPFDDPDPWDIDDPWGLDDPDPWGLDDPDPWGLDDPDDFDDSMAGWYDFAYFSYEGLQWTPEELDMDENIYIVLFYDGTGSFSWGDDYVDIEWHREGDVILLSDEESGEEYYALEILDEDSIAIESEGGYLVFVRETY